jgi:nucleoside-diphosphate-sugar epimerase
VDGYANARVAVAGASGFIGRWVARKLLEQGADVYQLGREETRDLETAYRRIRPSITFNLAGYGVDPLERDEAAAYQINADLPRMLAAAAAESRDPAWPGQHLVHAGSAAEYGDAGGGLREDGPARPTTLYGKSKQRGAMAVAELSKASGIRAVTARLFTIYGPGERPGRLLPSLIAASRTGQPLNLSSGTQRRDFTYVEDAAEGLLRLGLARGCYPIVNLATGRLTSVRAFIEIAAGILGIPTENLKFGTVPASIHEMEHEEVAVDRLRQLLNWTPPTSISQGVCKTLEFCLHNGAGSWPSKQ